MPNNKDIDVTRLSSCCHGGQRNISSAHPHRSWLADQTGRNSVCKRLFENATNHSAFCRSLVTTANTR